MTDLLHPLTFARFRGGQNRAIRVLGAGFVVALSVGLLAGCTEMGAKAGKKKALPDLSAAPAGKTGATKKGVALEVGDFVLTDKDYTEKMKTFAAAQLAGAPDAASKKQLEGRMYVDKAKGVFASDFSAFVLNDLLIDEIISEEVQFRKLRVKVGATPPASTLENLGGKEVFDKLPKEYRNRIIKREAEFEAIQADIKERIGTPEQYVKAHPEDFLDVCASHILVATEAEANKVIADVAAGKKFEDLAKKLSTDPGSGANGGSLGCTSPSTYVPEFAEATKTLKLNTLSKPVKTQFGYHVIKVTKRTPGSTEQATIKRDEAAQKDFTNALVSRLKATTIKVDPKLADIQINQEQGFPQIVPKPAPVSSATEVPSAELVPNT